VLVVVVLGRVLVGRTVVVDVESATDVVDAAVSVPPHAVTKRTISAAAGATRTIERLVLMKLSLEVSPGLLVLVKRRFSKRS